MHFFSGYHDYYLVCEHDTVLLVVASNEYANYSTISICKKNRQTMDLVKTQETIIEAQKRDSKNHDIEKRFCDVRLLRACTFDRFLKLCSVISIRLMDATAKSNCDFTVCCSLENKTKLDHCVKNFSVSFYVHDNN
jgi:hypothetical protein